jgi:hypothetical protein
MERFSVLIEEIAESVRSNDRLVLLRRGNEHTKRPGEPHIVGIHDGDQLNFGRQCIEPGIAGAAISLMADLQQLESWVAGAISPGYLGGVIGRPVVNYDADPVSILLYYYGT